MTSRPRRWSVDTTANTTLVTTAETVVATLSGVNTTRGASILDLTGRATLTTGTNTTAVTPRIRKDGLGGTIVGEGNPVTVGAAAGSTEVFSVFGTLRDTDLANGVFVLTLEQTAASANGSCLQAELTATSRS